MFSAWRAGRIRRGAARKASLRRKPTLQGLCLEALEDRRLMSTGMAAFGQLPLAFEPNQGQASARADFLAHGPGYGLSLTAAGADLSLQGAADTASPTVVQARLVGSNPVASAYTLDRLEGVSNYYTGNDPAAWHIAVPTYGQVAYHDVYPGVDLRYHGNQTQLEYDLIVAPAADPGVIRLTFTGVRTMALDGQGNLILHTASGDVIQHAPVVYQEVGGARRAVVGRFVMEDGQTVGFAIGAYDHTSSLTIDPVLGYSTFLGGSDVDGAFGIRVDAGGNAYVVGRTFSTNMPTAGPAQGSNAGARDAFVARLNVTGTGLVYATYLGGSANDEALNVAVDALGNAYVTGDTRSTDFPHGNAFQPNFGGGLQDAFVAKLNPTGGLLYSSYLGGNGFDEGLSIAVDALGNAYVVGDTQSTNLPTPGGLQPTFGGGTPPNAGDGFLAKISSDGKTLVYGTYLGGSANDIAEDVAVDSAGNIFVAGATTSTNFPLVRPIQSTYGGGLFDAFVAEINPAGTAFVYSTLLGGNDEDVAYGLGIDALGAAYVAGYTRSTNFPTVNALQAANAGDFDVFVTKILPGGTGIAYSTYLGGRGTDQAAGLAVDAVGNAYITGTTTSADFPTANPVQTALAGGADAFVTKITPDGSALSYSTYLGGTGNDFGNRIAVDAAGNAYVAGQTGSVDFPLSKPGQGSIGGADDGFVARIDAVKVGPPVNPGPVLSAVTVGNNPVMFALTGSHNLYRYDPAKGWAVLGGNIQQISAVTEPATGRAVVFVVTQDSGLYRFDDATGWQLIGAPGTIVSVSAGSDLGGRAAAFVRTTAADLQEFRGSSGWLASPLGARGTIIQISAVANDTVVAVTGDHSIFQYSAQQGWQRRADRNFAQTVSAVTDAAGRVIIFGRSLDQGLFRYDPATGWSLLGAPGTIRSAAASLDAAGQANVFVLTVNSDFIENDPLSGWTLMNPLGTVFEISPTASGRVFVGLADGSVFAHDPSGFSRLTSPGFLHV